jgi:hypothetical protein
LASAVALAGALSDADVLAAEERLSEFAIAIAILEKQEVGESPYVKAPHTSTHSFFSTGECYLCF